MDLAAFLQFGYGENHRTHGGAGFMMGKRYGIFEPYLGYSIRRYFIRSEDPFEFFGIKLGVPTTTQYLVLGNSLYFPESSYFLRTEVGTQFLGGAYDDVHFQWGASLGKSF